MEKVCVVGCSGGIGTAICKSVKEHGYYTIGIDQYNPNINTDHFFHVDLNSEKSIEELCKNLSSIGEFWGIIFGAGIYPVEDFENYTTLLWDEVMNVNLKSSFLIIQKINRQIKHGGRIVFISSGASYLGSKDIAYSVSKSGINGLAKGLSKHFAERILVNVISPGLFDSKMSRRMDKKRKQETIATTIVKRMGQPAELAEAVLFLLNADNSYMTGATIDINGGLYER